MPPAAVAACVAAAHTAAAAAAAAAAAVHAADAAVDAAVAGAPAVDLRRVLHHRLHRKEDAAAGSLNRAPQRLWGVGVGGACCARGVFEAAEGSHATGHARSNVPPPSPPASSPQ
jgi:hypothetical protein